MNLTGIQLNVMKNQETKFRRNEVLMVLAYLLFTMACKVSEKDKINETTTATTSSSIRYQPEELEADTRETILPFDSLKLTLVKSYSKTAFFETFADYEANTKVRIRHREVMINLTRNDITYNKLLTINTFRNYFGKELPVAFIFYDAELDSIDVKNHLVKFVIYLNVSDTDVRCVLNLVVNTRTFEDRWIVVEKPW